MPYSLDSVTDELAVEQVRQPSLFNSTKVVNWKKERRLRHSTKVGDKAHQKKFEFDLPDKELLNWQSLHYSSLKSTQSTIHSPSLYV